MVNKEINELTFACKLHKVIEIGSKRFNLVIDTATPTQKDEIINKLINSGYKIGLKNIDDSVVFVTLKKSDFWKLGEEDAK